MSNITFPVQIIPQIIQKRNLKVYFPAVAGLPASVQERINRAIYALAEDLIAKQGYYQNPRIQVTGWYEIKNNQRGILSLTLGNYAYAPQAAHGLTLIKALTFLILIQEHHTHLAAFSSRTAIMWKCFQKKYAARLLNGIYLPWATSKA